jgi:hypothetical protein
MPLKSSFEWLKKNYFDFLKQYQKEVFLLFVLLYPFSLVFYLQMEQFKTPTPDMDNMRIVTLLVQAVLDYLIQIFKQLFLFILLFGIYFHKKLKHPLSSIKKHFYQVFLEYIRCVLPILLKTLLLIVPGIIEYLRLAFVGLIVLFDKEYAQGNVDALEASRKWTNGHKVNILIIYLIYFALAIITNSLIASIVPPGAMNHFLVYTATFFIDIFTFLFLGAYFFAIFPKAQTDFQE